MDICAGLLYDYLSVDQVRKALVPAKVLYMWANTLFAMRAMVANDAALLAKTRSSAGSVK